MSFCLSLFLSSCLSLLLSWSLSLFLSSSRYVRLSFSFSFFLSFCLSLLLSFSLSLSLSNQLTWFLTWSGTGILEPVLPDSSQFFIGYPVRSEQNGVFAKSLNEFFWGKNFQCLFTVIGSQAFDEEPYSWIGSSRFGIAEFDFFGVLMIFGIGWISIFGVVEWFDLF